VAKVGNPGGGRKSLALCGAFSAGCKDAAGLSAFAELATKLCEDPIRAGKPALLRRGFVMTDELMFLARKASALASACASERRSLHRASLICLSR